MKPKKIKSIKLPKSTRSIEEITNMFLQKIKEQADKVFLEALKMHGYEFENTNDIVCFIAENCTPKTENNKRTYYVKGVPFMVYNENAQSVLVDEISGNLKIEANCGHYLIIKPENK